MEQSILKFAYFLQSSRKYYTIKHFVYQFLEDRHSKKKRYFDFFMIFLVLSTVGIMIYEVNHPLHDWMIDFEDIAIVFFILEWLGRLWTVSHIRKQIIEDYEKSQLINQPFNLKESLKIAFKRKLAFIFSPMSLVDLLAILPYYRPLRILRILMLFRLFKLLRYANSVKQFGDVFIEKKFEFFTLSIMFLMAVSFGSTVIFIYEGAGVNENIHNFFDAIYWSVITIATVGFGDISPVTIEGKVATLFLVIGGLSVIAFFTSIVTSALNEKLPELKEDKVKGEANALKDFVLICGYGQMGKRLAIELQKVKQNFIVIDNDDIQLEHTQADHILAIKGDATDVNFLENLGVVKGASTVVALANNDAINLAIILTVRSLNEHIKIIAKVNNSEIKDKFFLAGASEVISANDMAALVATEYIGQPIAFEAIDDILLSSEQAIMEEIEIVHTSKYINRSISEINFAAHNLILLGVLETSKKHKFYFNPPQDYLLQETDMLIVIGYKVAINKFRVEILS